MRDKWRACAREENPPAVGEPVQKTNEMGQNLTHIMANSIIGALLYATRRRREKAAPRTPRVWEASWAATHQVFFLKIMFLLFLKDFQI
jgi:hypothetical protein